MLYRIEDAIFGVSNPHADSPITVTGASQRFAITGQELYNFKTDGTGDCIIEFGDVTVVAVDTGVAGMLLRSDEVNCPYRTRNGHTHFAVIGFNSGTPKLFVEKLTEA